jgi:hypothetical protein
MQFEPELFNDWRNNIVPETAALKVAGEPPLEGNPVGGSGITRQHLAGELSHLFVFSIIGLTASQFSCDDFAANAAGGEFSAQGTGTTRSIGIAIIDPVASKSRIIEQIEPAELFDGSIDSRRRKLFASQAPANLGNGARASIQQGQRRLKSLVGALSSLKTRPGSLVEHFADIELLASKRIQADADSKSIIDKHIDALIIAGLNTQRRNRSSRHQHRFPTSAPGNPARREAQHLFFLKEAIAFGCIRLIAGERQTGRIAD